jgi:hypothetical protein
MPAAADAMKKESKKWVRAALIVDHMPIGGF